MCEQTEVEYLPNDVVWVKLRQPAIWWPGQVQDFDALPEEVQEGLRKKPLAVVKFFQEDAYEYVNNLNNIYSYNCSKKHEFIKKGLELARSKRPERPAHMDLFPQDVAMAETLTNGDPDIIRDDAFAPEEKPSYGGLFGSERKKKTPKAVVESILKERPTWRVKPLMSKQAGSPKTPSPSKLSKVITHPRFINKALSGESDYRIFIREQPVVEDETASPSSEYRCHNCDFVTARLNVIVLHYRSHSKTVTPVPNRSRLFKVKTPKSGTTKPKAEKKADTPSKSSPTEPPRKRNILKETSPAPSPSPTPTPAPTEKTSSKKSAKRKAKTEQRPEEDVKKVKKEEIQELLKDWSDDEVETEPRIVQRYSDGDDDKSIDDETEHNEIKMDVDEPAKQAEEVSPKAEEEKIKTKEAVPAAPKSKAVFDFDDSDDGLDPTLTHNTRVIGRKLPRVIDNIKERRSSFPEGVSSPVKSPPEPSSPKEKKKRESSTAGKKKSEEVKAPAIADEAVKKEVDDSVERQKELEDMSAEIDSLLEKTSVPELPSIPKISGFSFDTTDDDYSPTEKSKASEEEKGNKGSEEEKDSKDKSILREHNDIASSNLKDGVEEVAQPEDSSKNSLPEVGSAVEKNSTPPQADPVINTAERATKVEKVAKTIVTSVVLTAPQSTSGGDHSYVSDKSPPKMPPLIATTQPKSVVGKSPQTMYISGKTGIKSTSSRRSQESNVMRVVSIAPTSTVTSKPITSLVKKDGKYVLVRSTQSSERKLMPGLTSVSSPKPSASPQKIRVAHVTAPSRKVSSSQAAVASPVAGLTQVSVSSPKAVLPKLSVSSPKTGLTQATLSTKLSPAKTSVSSSSVVTQQGKKLVILTKKPSGDFVLGPQKQTNVLTKAASKDVSLSKAAPSVIVSASTSPTTLQKLPESRTVVPSTLPPKKSILFSTAGGVIDAKAIVVSVSDPIPPSLEPGSPLFNPYVIPKSAMPKNVTLVSSKESPGKVTFQMESQERKVILPSMAQVMASVKPGTRNILPPVKRGVTVASKNEKVTKLQTKEPLQTPTITQPIKKQPLKRTPVLLSRSSVSDTKGFVSSPLKPSILQSSSRGSVKRNVTPKVTLPGKETEPELGVATVAAQETGLVEGSQIVAASAEGAVEGGASIMYVLDNGTVISYEQVDQVDNQPRTVFIDPASLTPSSGELGNLIFAFDESTGNEGTLLNITQPTESAETAEFTFTPAEKPPGSTTQDILAEALANTQVLQAEASASELILDSSSLPANTIPHTICPSNPFTLSNNVLETSLTLNQPIMTPLEVPSAVSSLQPPPASTGSLELPITIAQPDITISTSSYASLPIPSATIQGAVFSDPSNATFSVLSDDSGKQTFYVQTTDTESTFAVADGTTAVFACDDQVTENATVSPVEDAEEIATSQDVRVENEAGPEC